MPHSLPLSAERSIVRVARLVLACLVGVLAFASASAQDTFPSRPVKLVVPFAAGGATDVIARAVGAEMAKVLGQAVVIDNKVGAAGGVAADAVAAAPADGYTVCVCGSGPMILLPLIDSAAQKYPRELAPVGLIYLSEYILIGSASLKPNTASELIADIRANPGKYSFGSSGVGGIQQLGMELLSSALNGKMTHIPYKGEQPAAVDVASGQVNLLMSTASTALPLLKAGKVKAFAVTGEDRNPEFPDLPPLVSLGLPSVVVYTHAGLNVPKGTPAAAVEKLSSALVTAMKAPSVREVFKTHALITPKMPGPQGYADYVARETMKWDKITKSIDFKRQ